MASRTNLISVLPEWHLLLAGGALFTAGLLARGLLTRPRKPSVIRSPRLTLLPTLSDKEKAALPYPPDVLPGARDVDTPYGSIRVYEFGPENGRKVLLVHGISTPAIALGGVAHALVDNGCRIMLFDLFGRGYSDTPGDLQHDVRLFTTQILLCLATSPLSWTGEASGKFSIIGYSLGGGIAATFASYFPNLVDSLILFAPAGLLRPYHISRTNHIIYSEGVIPESLVQRLVKNRLRSPMAAPPKKLDQDKIDPTQAMNAEVAGGSESQAVLSKTYPNLTVEKAVGYQLDHHQGFVPAFISSIRYAPIREEHSRWRVIGERLQAANAKGGNQKVLIICGRTDPIIILNELEQDATQELLGNVEFAVFEAGHEVAVTKGEETVKAIMEFWQRTS